MEDPDYGRAHYRKCLILEHRGDYAAGLNLAEFSIKQYSNEYESDEANVKIVPMFEELVIRLKEKLPFENQDKESRME